MDFGGILVGSGAFLKSKFQNYEIPFPHGCSSHIHKKNSLSVVVCQLIGRALSFPYNTLASSSSTTAMEYN